MSERLVVIGGDAAGMSAAAQVRRRHRFCDIVALERGHWTSYSACGIPYLVAGDVDDHHRLVVRSPEQFRDQYRIDVRTRHEVMAVDLDERRVEVRDHDRQRTYRLGFDQLHVATGAHPIRPDLPGIDHPMVHGVQTLDEGVRLLRQAEAIGCRRVVVVGGGYIGLEMADAFLRRGVEVTVVEADSQLMGTLDADMAGRVAGAMRRMGIDVRTGVRAEAFVDGGVETDQGTVPADLVVLGLGVAPNARLAADAGLVTGVRGAVRTDRRQQTSVEGVYAAGDCAETVHRVSGRPVHVALGTVANKQGRVAGINLSGGYATFPGVVGTAITKVSDLEIGRTGLSSTEADAAGFRYVVADIESTTRAGYYPGAAPIAIRLLAEVGSRRVIGAQIVGREGAAKRIDVLATAITAAFTVDEVIDLDLAYAPPFSGVWDPVHLAARRAAHSLDGDGEVPH